MSECGPWEPLSLSGSQPRETPREPSWGGGQRLGTDTPGEWAGLPGGLRQRSLAPGVDSSRKGGQGPGGDRNTGHRPGGGEAWPCGQAAEPGRTLGGNDRASLC